MRDDVVTLLQGSKAALANTTNAALVSLTVNSAVIDTQGETGGAFMVNVSAITGGELTLSVRAGDASDGTGDVDVTDEILEIGRILPITAAGVYLIGYQGIKRYVRCTVSGNAGLTGAVVNALYASVQASRGA